MDLQAAKDLNAGLWRMARVGVLVCFALAGLLLVMSLLSPPAQRAGGMDRPDIRLGLTASPLPNG